MRRMVIAMVVLAATSIAATALTACGAEREADKKLDGAMGEYRSALEEVQKLDLRGATQADIDAARAGLADRWQDVERRADTAGRDIDKELVSAQAQVDKALEKARDGVGAGVDESERALDTALDAAGAALKKAWSAIKDLL